MTEDEIAAVLEAGGDDAKKLLESVKPNTPLARRAVFVADELDNDGALLVLFKNGVTAAANAAPLRRALVSAAESIIEERGNQEAARIWSTVGDDDGNAWITASFGTYTAVNGDLVGDDEAIPEAPKGYRLTGRGGEIPTTEVELSGEFVAEQLLKDLGITKTPEALNAVVAAIADKNGMIYTSASGEADIYVKPSPKPAVPTLRGRASQDDGEDDGEDDEVPAFIQPVDHGPKSQNPKKGSKKGSKRSVKPSKPRAEVKLDRLKSLTKTNRNALASYGIDTVEQLLGRAKDKAALKAVTDLVGKARVSAVLAEARKLASPAFLKSLEKPTKHHKRGALVHKKN